MLGPNRISTGNYPIGAGLFPLLAPTLIMSGMALLLLVIQQDLGTATIFLLLYATIIYVATGDFRVIWLSIIGLLIAFVGGYRLFEIVQIRVEAWLNPFLDPSGNSYQIVQSLIAFANGEIFGRGLGIGYPNLVPVAHSDFIFTSIVEEQGFLGGMALISCLVILFYRGIRAALKTSELIPAVFGYRINRLSDWTININYWRQSPPAAPYWNYSPVYVIWWFFAGSLISIFALFGAHQSK